MQQNGQIFLALTFANSDHPVYTLINLQAE